MDYKAIIQKALRGEALTDEEKTAVKDFDFGKYLDGAQAEARRKAEAAAESERKAREALEAEKAKLEAALNGEKAGKKSEVEKLQDSIRELSGKFEAAQKKADELTAAQARAQRSAKVQDLAKKFGVSFIDGVDSKILAGALEGSLASVENLDDENLVKPLVESFKSANKAVIRDTSGGGSGTPPKDGSGPRGLDGKPVDQMSTAEREKDLKTRGII